MNNENDLSALLDELQQPLYRVNMGQRIEICRQALNLVDRQAQPDLWAAIQTELAISITRSVQNGQSKDNEEAFEHLNLALEVLNREYFPSLWSNVQNTLGNAYINRQFGEKGENIEKAIQHYLLALEERSRFSLSLEWATTQYNLGVAYLAYPSGDRADNLEKALRHFQQSLEVRKPDKCPLEWADTQVNLASTYGQRILGERSQNLESAIEHLNHALQIYTPDRFPYQWAMTHKNLGLAYKESVIGDKIENLNQAIKHWQIAQQVFTKNKFPEEWRQVQNLLIETTVPERHQAYLELIEGLLNCPDGKEIDILKAHEDLLDIQLIPVIEQVAEELEDNNQVAANWLRNFAAQLSASIIKTPSAISSGDSAVFLAQVLKAVAESHGNPQVVYPLLQANLSRLDSHFAQLISVSLSSVLSELENEEAVGAAAVSVKFSDLMLEFPLGNKADNLEIAIAIYQAILNFYTVEVFSKDWARVQGNLGSAYLFRIRGNRAENEAQAIQCYLKALSVFTYENFPEDWAGTQLNLGNAYNEKLSGNRSENQEQAIHYYQNALQVFTYKTHSKEWAEVQNYLGNVYVYRSTGDRAENLEQAITYFHNSLQVLTPESAPRDWAGVQHNLGNAYRERMYGKRSDNLEQAITCYTNALRFLTIDSFPEWWAKTQNCLAVTYRARILGERADNLELAIACYENSLRVLTTEKFPFDWALTQNNLSNVYGERVYGDRAENLEQALICSEKALEVLNIEEYPHHWALTYLNLAVSYLDRTYGDRSQNLEKAVECCQNALKIYRLNTFPQERITTLFNLGSAYERSGQLELSYTTFSQAINEVEFVRETIFGDEAKQRLAEQWTMIYRRVVDLCLKLAKTEPNYYDRAIEYIEQNKARNLVELLADRDLYPKGNIPDSIIQKLEDLRRQIVVEQRQIWNSQSSNFSRLYQLKQQLDTLISNEISSLDPTFQKTQKLETISFNQIQSLIDDSTAILEFYFSSESFQLFIVHSQSSHPIVWNYSSQDRESLRKLARDYSVEYVEDAQGKPEWRASLLCRLNYLAEILKINQVVELLPESCDRIIFIPHLFLHLLPLHALPLANQTCLVDRFTRGVSYAPSCQLLDLVKNWRRNFSQFFGVQNPTQDLKYSDLEIDVIEKFFQPNSQILIHEKAIKESLKSQYLNTANCVHFACHGYFNFVNPLQSSLILARANNYTKPSNEIEESINVRASQNINLEQYLTLGEIFGLDLAQCRLVVLSACESGLSDWDESDEYIGLSSGFLVAGSPAVVSSLWTVNDLSTALLMIKFYENLHHQMTLAVALNQAQMWLRDVSGQQLKQWIEDQKVPLSQTLRTRWLKPIPNDDQPFRDPFYWAAFCAIGQ